MMRFLDGTFLLRCCCAKLYLLPQDTGPPIWWAEQPWNCHGTVKIQFVSCSSVLSPWASLSGGSTWGKTETGKNIFRMFKPKETIKVSLWSLHRDLKQCTSDKATKARQRPSSKAAENAMEEREGLPSLKQKKNPRERAGQGRSRRLSQTKESYWKKKDYREAAYRGRETNEQISEAASPSTTWSHKFIQALCRGVNFRNRNRHAHSLFSNNLPSCYVTFSFRSLCLQSFSSSCHIPLDALTWLGAEPGSSYPRITSARRTYPRVSPQQWQKCSAMKLV